MKNAGLGTGMAGGIKVLWDQVLLTGGNIRKFGLGAEPGESFVEMRLCGNQRFRRLARAVSMISISLLSNVPKRRSKRTSDTV